MNPREAPVVEVITAVEGWCSLARRSPTLDGSLPLRVAQGCLPMLDGTALGLQVELEVPLRVYRRWSRWRVDALPAHRRVSRWGLDTDPRAGADDLARADARRAAVAPSLVAQGILDAAWIPRTARPLAEIVRDRTTSRLRLWTGLLARVPGDVRLLALRASPRRTLGVDLAPAVIPAQGAWAPVCVDLALDDAVDEVVLQGEVATLAVVPATVPARRLSLPDAPEAARAFLDFFDAAYFDAKRGGEVTRKYRRLVADEVERSEAAMVTLVEAGPRELTDDALPTLAPEGLRRDAPSPAVFALRAAMDLRARFDGQRVWVDADADAMAARRRAVEAAWAPFATPDDPARRGALWYLTKYLTPHPPGEPHFFVKPCALVVTPPGWSTLVEGVAVPGVGDTLRGVVHTDRFHATPAVFALPAAARPGRVAAGATLARILPLPRAWATPALERVTFALR